MSDRTELKLTLADHQSARREVSSLLEMFVATIMNVVGGGASPVCRAAGRHAGRRLPVDVTPMSLDAALGVAARSMKGGLTFTPRRDEEGADLRVTRCALRAVCADRGVPVGGDICSMFHAYLGGMLQELVGAPVRVKMTSAGEEHCELRVAT